MSSELEDFIITGSPVLGDDHVHENTINNTTNGNDIHEKYYIIDGKY